MKQRLFKLIMLLTTIVMSSGAWADTTIYSWVSTGADATGVTETGGTASGKIAATTPNATIGALYALNIAADKFSALKTTSDHVSITLSNGTFKKGDKITVSGFYNKGQVKTVSLAILPGVLDGGSSGTDESSVTGLIKCTDSDWPDLNGATEKSTATHTYELTSAYEEESSITLTRNSSGTTLFVTSLTITRADPTAPTFTTDLASAASVKTGKATEFSTEASGADSYQWYTCDDADKTNATAISGATSATYSYTAAADGTAYIYCAATNTYGTTNSTVCAVTAAAVSYPNTATWDFASYGKYGTSATGFQYQKSSGTLVSSDDDISMSVDATNGKLSSRDDDTQWNANTILTIPVSSANDKIYIKAKSNAYTVGGVAATDAEATYSVSYAAVAAGHIDIVATGSNYLYTITLTQNEPNTTVPELLSFKANGTAYYPGDLSSTKEVAIDLANSATMISSENPLTDVTTVCGTVGTIAYQVAADNNSCIATIPVSLEGADDVTYTVTFTRLQNVTVAFYGLDGTKTKEVSVAAGETIGASNFPADPTATTGYTFRGWYYDSATEGATKANATDKANTNLNIYALQTKTETTTGVYAYDLKVKTFDPEIHDNIAINGDYTFNGTQHGIQFSASNTVDLKVGGHAYIVIGSCKYSSGDYTLTGCDAQTAKVSTDGDNVTFHYEGDAGTISLGFGGTTYVHSITIYNTSFVAEKKNGYYQIPANDAAGLKYASTILEDGDKIFLPNGTYDLGSDLTKDNAGMTISASNVSLIGESMAGVIIKGSAAAADESINTATIKVTGDNFYAQDFTSQCYAGYNTANKAERGVALWNRAAHSTLKNVYLKGTQDTYYTNYAAGAGQYGYVEGGKIEGTVDFICGAGNHYFNGVNLYAANSSAANKTTGDYLTAPNTYSGDAYGYVFKDAVIDGESSQDGTYYLARAWNNEPRCAYINATKNIAPASDLWTKMGSFSGTSHFADVTAETGYEIGTVLGDWATTAQNEATQKNSFSDYREGDVLLVNGELTTTLPGNENTSFRMANGRGGFGSEVCQLTEISHNEAGWASFCPIGYNATIKSADVKLYIATAIKDDVVTLKEIKYIPANTGVFAYYAEWKSGVTIETGVFPCTEADDVTGNLIVGCTEDTELTADGSEFIMGVVNGEAGFWKVETEGVTVPAGKAYFKAPTTTNAKNLTFVFEETTTGIENIESKTTKSAAFYNLAGQKVDSNYKGIAIGADGKKYIK